ncbi:MAG: ECF transporter S component [candidate division Zixibacteria bacterium]|nr:ECF transporter S component [candidate division Zixibacteria bacterium]
MKFLNREISLTGLFIALGVALPIAFHFIHPLAGRTLLPMHIPVLLAGILLGPISGIIVGLVCPTTSFLLTGMPPAYAVPLMTLELALYGLASGILVRKLRIPLIPGLLLAMIVGRFGFAFALFVLGRFIQLPYDVKYFILYAIPTGLPGVILQIVLIPALVKGIQLASRIDK